MTGKLNSSAVTTNPDPLLDRYEAAAYLGVSHHWIRQAVLDRRLDVVKVGGVNRFRRSTLDAFIEANTRPAAVPQPSPAQEPA